MRRFCAIALVLFAAVPAKAAEPLRLVPAEAHLAIKVEKPRQLLESFLALDVFRQLEKLDAVQDVIGSSNSRQFYQLVAYFEKELGASWPQLLDGLAGDGAVLAVKYGYSPTPALLVVEARDEALLKKFVALSLQVIEQELARQGIQAKPVSLRHHDVTTLHIGDQFNAAMVGKSLLISNRAEALRMGIDLHLDASKKSVLSVAGLSEAKRPDALAWLWLDMDAVRQLPNVKEAFNALTLDVNATLFLGSWVDLLKRAGSVQAALLAESGGFTTRIRLPAGKEGAGPALSPFLPPAGQPASLPVLQPRGVLLSTSYYWDLGKYWTEREKLFNAEQRQAFEEADKQSGLFLAGNNLSKLLTQSGPYQRFVMAHPDKLPYQKTPGTRIPSFGLVLSMKDAQFGKSMETLFRTAALFTTTQLSLKMTEEMHGGVKLVGYRFPEDGKLDGDATGVRFNFYPCFATVGDQFVMASTMDLGRELIDLLHQEAKNPARKGEATERTVFFSAGAADLLKGVEDQILAQTMLDRAQSPAEAKKQVELFLELVRKLGTFELAAHYGDREFHYDIRFKPGK